MSNNLSLTKDGKLSISQRNESLTNIYTRINQNLKSGENTFSDEDQDMENGNYDVIALHQDIIASQREKIISTDIAVNV